MVTVGGEPANMTGYTAYWTVTPKQNPTDNTGILFRKTGTFTQPAEGIWDQELTLTDTQAIDARTQYYYDLSLQNGDGTEIVTAATGGFRVSQTYNHDWTAQSNQSDVDATVPDQIILVHVDLGSLDGALIVKDVNVLNGFRGKQGPPGASLPIGGSTRQVLAKLSGTDFIADWVTLSKSDVQLGNVDNTPDSSKPVSTAQQAALDAKVPAARTVNGHALTSDVTVSKADVGLSSVPNVDATQRTNHTGTQSADTLTDGTTNKAYTGTERTKLAAVEPGAQVNTVTSVAGKTGAVAVTKTDVGLSSVTNDAQLKATQLDPDSQLAAASDLLVATQKATRTYADRIRTTVATVYAAAGDFPISSYANASAAIQAALNYVGGLSAGGDVYVGDDCTITTALAIPTNVTLRGRNGTGTKLTLAASQNGHVIVNKDQTTGNSKLGIRDIEIDANKASNTTTRGVYFKNVTAAQLYNVKVSNAATEGFYWELSTQIKAERCEARSCTGNGVMLVTTSWSAFRNGVSDDNNSGVQLSAKSDYNSITGNQITNSHHYSLLGGTATDTLFNSYNTFSHNLIKYGGDDALVLDHNPFTTCIGNYVGYCGGTAGDQGLPIDTSANSVVSGNIIEFNYADGIELKNSSINCTITGNICRNNTNVGNGSAAALKNGCGIIVRAGITGCTITGNICYCDEVPGSQLRGIMLTGVGVDYNTVSGNTVFGNATNQIECSSNIGTNNVVYGNSGTNSTNTNVLVGRMPDQPVKMSNATTSPAIDIVQTGLTGTNVATQGAIHLDNTLNSDIGLGLYTNYAAGGRTALMKATNANNLWDFAAALQDLTNATTQNGVRLTQSYSLASSRAALLIESSTAMTTNTAYGLFAVRQPDTGSLARSVWIDHFGTNEAMQIRVSQGKGIIIDNNGAAIGVDLDQDANSASEVIGMRLDVVNAGAGTATALKLQAGRLDANNQKIANVPTPATGTEAANKSYVDSAVAAIGGGPRNWTPTDQGLIGWSLDITSAQATSILSTAGVMFLARIPIAADTTISNVYLDVATAGVGLTSAGVAVYQGTTLIGQSADQSTAFQSTGTKTIALTGAPLSITAGYIYVGVWANGTTLPTFIRGTGRSSINLGLSAANSRFATSGSSITTTAPSTLGTLAASSLSFFMAVGQ
ncbi:right-handed parallel beta-helix repeat-containing protein [Streptomyces europaeiscabiei]|uniref:right-handed parallel beta-helix repeat-containing protein n=1 Tax=Streptomyces europaeiscabiei TaxID=146819 RepID=UPI00131E5027|nr:right-handed parallel beta-helix repeat-containing protein [Streptomyces europaeiscabiei]